MTDAHKCPNCGTKFGSMFGMTWIIDNTIPEGSVEFRQDGRTVGRININSVEPSKGEAPHVAE